MPALVDARIAVLVSGAGSNLQALLDDPLVGPWIKVVVSDQPGAVALERARAHDVKSVAMDPGNFRTRADRDRWLSGVLEGQGIEFVLLAGYMRIIGPEVVRSFYQRILNVHPSLLPAFPGAHAVRDALEWGVKVTGATVHLVDEEVDHGPVVLQEPVLVLADDDEHSLHLRIQTVEHRLFPQATRLLVEGRLRVEGRSVQIMEEGSVRR